MVAVFWTGLAVWLLFAVAPLRAVLSLVQRRRRCERAPVAASSGAALLQHTGPPRPTSAETLVVNVHQPQFPAVSRHYHHPFLPAHLPPRPPPCSTVTGGLPFQETLGSGLRQGLDDAYAAQVGEMIPP